MSYVPDKLKTFDECLSMMHEETRDLVVQSCKKYGSTGVLIFECEDMSSDMCGERFAIPYGPNNTLTEPPADGKCRVEPPYGRAWQYYLAAYSATREIVQAGA